MDYDSIFFTESMFWIQILRQNFNPVVTETKEIRNLGKWRFLAQFVTFGLLSFRGREQKPKVCAQTTFATRGSVIETLMKKNKCIDLENDYPIISFEKNLGFFGISGLWCR